MYRTELFPVELGGFLTRSELTRKLKELGITAGHYQYNEQEQEVFTNQNIKNSSIMNKEN